MNIPRRLACAAAVAASLATAAFAQTPPPYTGNDPVRGGVRQSSPAAPNSPAPRRKSIVHHYPYPYPNHYVNDQTAGFRNPGGSGRYLEYYPPGNQFQDAQPRDPVRVARFDQGGGAPDRAEQLQAEQLGIQRYNSIQSHIDNMSRPFIGYGVGYFGGVY